MRDPSAGRPPRRRPGRPARTSMAELVDAAVDLGLDTFTITAVAARVGVGESTVYGYVTGRDELFTAAAASVFARLDVASEAATWHGYVDEVAQRVVDLAAAHPGLRDYVLWGPYAPETVAAFEALVARVWAYLPDIPEHVAWVIASRPTVLALGYLGDPVLEATAPWLRRALLRGLDEQIAAGDLPPEPAVPWRSKIRPPGGSSGAGS